ncbi:hypothetical protein ElyMa_000947000 [Elysia marginata]|uniref:Uncharacterized protein n=1 Tax=Elysia marginata TaxID=1093978 RepID=A0AAV4HFB8_9GAST|nr:hypothetical protein ElyMa_000947000 [Elysia marginata]
MDLTKLQSRGREPDIPHLYQQLFRSSLQDIKVFKRAYVGSDHHLLVAKINLKLRKGKFAPHLRTKYMYNVNLLSRPQKREEYAIDVANRFHALETLRGAEGIKDYCNKIKGE